jgi:hypothetical protein
VDIPHIIDVETPVVAPPGVSLLFEQMHEESARRSSVIFASLVCLLQESTFADLIQLLVEEWLEFIVIDQVLAIFNYCIGLSATQFIFDYSYRVSVRFTSIAIVFDERAHICCCVAHKI